LVETNRQILYDNSLSLENLVINELIAGPNTEDMYPTLPSTLKVLSVSTKDGICYVNLDSSFVTDALDVAEYVPIYSIVNSLVELSGITKVQISVNGSFDLVFKEKIPLTQIFEWNSDYLGGDYH
jgi:germination protein M